VNLLKNSCYRIISDSSDNLSDFNKPLHGALLGNLAFCIFIFLIGYFGVKQESIFIFSEGRESSIIPDDNIQVTSSESVSNTLMAEKNVSDRTINDKYKNSGLNKQKSLELFATLQDFMRNKKPYQDTELTLFMLAKQLGIHPNHLSPIINQHHNQNFFDYVNEYRVNDVKDALLSNKYDSHSLLGVAFECGFNSKASFNRAFKKFTGLTPSEFRNKSST
jgi:AraC-like DNA-binding protein